MNPLDIVRRLFKQVDAAFLSSLVAGVASAATSITSNPIWIFPKIFAK